MEYLVVRLYDAGDTGRKVDELCQMAVQELAPQLIQQDGVLRYTVFKIDDRRYGSTTLCRRHQDAEAGNKIAAEWVSRSPAMQALRLVQRLQGERFYAYQGSSSVPSKGTFGTMRVWRSSASAEEVQRAFEQELEPLFRQHEGLLRVSVFKAEQPDTYVALGTYRSRDSSTQLNPKVSSIRQRSGSLIAKAIPNDPEVTEATIFDSFAKS